MSLATTCPQCKTSFKVVPDQLKLRRGLVRCGVCQHVFSGIDYLRYVDDAARTAQRLARERAAAGPGASSTPGEASAPQKVVPDLKAAGASQAGASFVSPPGAPAPSPTSRPPAPDGTSDTQGRAAHDAAAFGGLVTRTGGTNGGIAPTGPVRPPSAAPSPRARPAETPAASTASEPAAPVASAATALEVPGKSPADPWAAAAHAAHERSLREAAPDKATRRIDPLRGAGSLAPGAFEPGRAMPGSGADPWAAASTSTGANAATTAMPAAAAALATHAATGFPALPAPGARRETGGSLDDLLARPTVPWPTTAGPRTVISGDEDLKTAFFLPDSAFGPQTGNGVESGQRTISGPASHIDAIDPEPITRLRPEARRPPREGGAVGLPLQSTHGFFDEATIDAPMTEIAGVPSRRKARAPERAIDYFPGVRNRSRGLGLALSPAAWIASGALTLLLGLQAVVGWRDGIAARAPFVAPLLGTLLAPFGATIAPPRDLDALTIEGFELQPAGSPNRLQLSAVLRNGRGHAVGYPAMELTLTDSVGALLVRKVIPVDAWLPDPVVRGAGIAAGTERPLRLALEHNGLQPTGYTVSLFYP